MTKFTEEQIEQIARACGWEYHSPAKPLPMAKDSDAKAYMTWAWETPEGLGSFEPDLHDLNVVMDMVKNFLKANYEYNLKVIFDSKLLVVLMKNHRLIYEEIVEYAELSHYIVDALWVAEKQKSRGKI